MYITSHEHIPMIKFNKASHVDYSAEIKSSNTRILKSVMLDGYKKMWSTLFFAPHCKSTPEMNAVKLRKERQFLLEFFLFCALEIGYCQYALYYYVYML